MSEIQKKVNIADEVLTRVKTLEEGKGLVIPPNYSAENALKGAWLILQSITDKEGNLALKVCTQDSIANALFEMVTKGLSVVKKQGYFIPYGKVLNFQESYFGNLAMAKRQCEVMDVKGAVVYEGDKGTFKYEVDVSTGRKRLLEHGQDLENIDNNKIAGAYAVVMYEDGTTDLEVMKMVDIRTSWEQGKAKGNSPAHTNFPDQMAIKTVMNRAIKLVLASSDDSHLNMEQNIVDAEPIKPETIELAAIEDAEEVKAIEPSVEEEDRKW